MGKALDGKDGTGVPGWDPGPNVKWEGNGGALQSWEWGEFLGHTGERSDKWQPHFGRGPARVAPSKKAVEPAVRNHMKMAAGCRGWVPGVLLLSSEWVGWAAQARHL